MDWTKKIAVITGASTGIGQATRELLQQNGCIVYNLDVNSPSIPDAHFISCDVAKKDDIRAAIDLIISRENRIDFLFANAGIHLFANLEETSDEQFQKILSINIGGVFHALKCVIPVMKKQNKGSIVIMGSDQSFIGKGSSSVYGLTKGALAQLTKSTAIDYAPFNIRVNCICPGTIDTPLLHKSVAHFSSKSGKPIDEIDESLKTMQPMGRIGRPEEIARSVAFLLSDDSSFTTGSLLSVDGGYVCQ
jgi:NAD(P)-dependent dehydrogenase (short-subunit alcohol dehydrogenase family)